MDVSIRDVRWVPGGHCTYDIFKGVVVWFNQSLVYQYYFLSAWNGASI